MSNWCDQCDRREDGLQCAVCGAELSAPAKGSLPWRWRLFLVGTAVYIVWRVYQLISWLAH